MTKIIVKKPNSKNKNLSNHLKSVKEREVKVEKTKMTMIRKLINYLSDYFVIFIN
jgi:hypothetical protein